MEDEITTFINGVKKDYDVLFTTHDEKNNNDYVIYTDNEVNENGDVKIYLGRYKDNEILPISKEEKEKLEKIVNIVQKEICNENK